MSTFPTTDKSIETQLVEMMTAFRGRGPKSIMQVFLAPLGIAPEVKPEGWQCELAFGDESTRSFQAPTFAQAVNEAHAWAYFTCRFEPRIEKVMQIQADGNRMTHGPDFAKEAAEKMRNATP